MSSAMDESRSPPPEASAQAQAASTAYERRMQRQQQAAAAAAAAAASSSVPSQQQQQAEATGQAAAAQHQRDEEEKTQDIASALSGHLHRLLHPHQTPEQMQQAMQEEDRLLQIALQQRPQQQQWPLPQQQQQQQQQQQHSAPNPQFGAQGSQGGRPLEQEAAMCIVCHESDRPLAPVTCCGQMICASCPPTLSRLGLRIRCPACRNEPVFLQWFNTNFPAAAAAAASNVAPNEEFIEQVERAHAATLRQQYAENNRRFQATISALDSAITQTRANPFDATAIGQLFQEHTIPLGDNVRREGLLRATNEHNTAVGNVATAKEAVLLALERLRDSVRVCAIRAARKAEYEAVLNDMHGERVQTRAEAYNAAMSRRARQAARAAARFAPY